MELNSLTAVSPVDGRYRNKVDELAHWFSEFALIKYRCAVEVAYFEYLCRIPLPELAGVDQDALAKLKKRVIKMDLNDAQAIKEIEKTTNHDVKAVEYFIKQLMDEFGLSDHKEFVHFGLTSQDINNTAIPMALKHFCKEYYLPTLRAAVADIAAMAQEWSDVPMLARTHGQAASPTRLGKEFQVFVERLENQMEQLTEIPITAKFGGATGNFNAHHVAYPSIEWPVQMDTFLFDELGLQRQQFTTQIEHYDNMAALFDCMRRINVILLDMCRDVWTYVSMDYFTQRTIEGEVGSSAMPHKVNPIDFENAEGNLGLANAMFDHLASKLPISRLQRDLTDSTVTRNIGVPMAHTIIAFASVKKGFSKLQLNAETIAADLSDNWAVVAEAIQTVLRRSGVEQPYEQLKALTRGKKSIGEADIRTFIGALDISDELKTELLAIRPENYTGVDLMNGE
jgi:adenylosuccinate lyase